MKKLCKMMHPFCNLLHVFKLAVPTVDTYTLYLIYCK